MNTNDQAHRLRELTKNTGTNCFLQHKRRRNPPKIISIVSGRGGVGKSFLALNLACFWALRSKNTLLVDADFAMGHLDYLLGLNPKHTIQHLIEGKSDFEKTVLPGPWGLKLIPGMAGVNGNPALPAHFAGMIIPDLAMHDDWADIMICDTTSGVSEPTIDIITQSDELLLVTTPETASVMDLYAMIKFISGKFGEKQPRMRIVVNRVKKKEDGRRIAKSIRGVAGRFLGRGIQCIGFIPDEPDTEEAARKHIPFISHAPVSAAARALDEIATTLMEDFNNPIISNTIDN